MRQHHTDPPKHQEDGVLKKIDTAEATGHLGITTRPTTTPANTAIQQRQL